MLKSNSLKMMNEKSLIDRLIIAGLFLIPFIAFVKYDGLLFPYITGKAFLFRTLVELLFIGWIALILASTRIYFNISKISIALFCFILVMGFATLFAENSYRSFWSGYERMDGFITLIHLALYYILLVTVINTREIWTKFWLLFLFCSALMAGYNIYEIVNSLNISGVVGRNGAFFGNPTYLSAFILFLFFVNIYLFMEKKINHWIFGFLCLLHLLVIYFTGTRGAVLGLVGGLGFVALIYAFGGKRHSLVLSNLSRVFLFSLILLTALFLFSKNTSFVQNNTTLSRFANITLSNVEKQDSRLIVWPMAYEGFKEKPVLGWGQENFIYLFDKYYSPQLFDREQFFDKAHNVLLDWMVAGGVLGVLSYLSIFLVAFYVLWKETQVTFLAKSILSGLMIAYLMQNLFVFDNLMGYILFITLLAYLNFISSTGKRADVNNAGILIPNNVKIVLSLLSVFLVVLALYYANYKPLKAGQKLAQAIEVIGKEGRHSEYIKKIEEALSLKTFGSNEVILNLANAAPLFLQSDVSESLQRSYFNLTDREFERHLKKDSGDVRSRIVYGLFLTRFEQEDRALDQYLKALELSPKRQSIWLTIGAIYLDLERFDDAVQFFKNAYELEPRFNSTRIWYAISLVYTNQKESALNILVDVPVDLLVADDRLINAYIAMGNHAELIPLYEARVKASPNDPQANISLAVALVKSGNFSESAQVLEVFVDNNIEYTNDLQFYIDEIRAGRDPSR